MKKTKLTRSLLAACSIVALSAVMYGCTGDGSENDLKATQGDLDQTEMDLEEALAARDAALAAQATAEAARDAALAAQATAEMERDAANAAQAAADAARMTAEQAQADAEAAQAAAEAAQAAAQMAQATAEAAQAMAESQRDAANAARDLADAARAEAEQAARDAASGQATAVAEAAAANMRADAAEAEAAAAETRADAAEDARDAALAAQMAAEVERDNANQIAGDAEAERDAAVQAQMAAEAERDAALAAQAEAEAERDMYKQMAADAEEDRMAAENLARVKGVGVAISGNRVSAADRDRRTSDGTTLITGGTFSDSSPSAATQMPFGTDADDGTTAGAHGITAERDEHGAVTVSLPTALKFSDGTGTASADDPWTGATMMTRRMGGSTATLTDDAEQQVVVYTNIGEPTPNALATDFEAGETYVLVDTEDERGLVMPASAPAAGGPAFSYGANHEFAGNYRDFPGTFTCVATCTIATDADGKVTVGGNMNFAPDDLAAIYYTDDTSYAYFGWWLHKPDNANGAHMVESFAGGNNIVTDANAADATGTATYEGPAAGKYVTETYTAGTLAGGDAGHFTATATLRANFDAAVSGDLTADMISGSIDNFVLSSGNDASDWQVTLKDAASNVAQFGGATDVTFGGATTSGAGNWRAAFYDAPAAGSPAGSQPGTVAGTFDAHTAGASLTGGFGATKQ